MEWVTGSGKIEDGSDSIANQIVPATHWPEMRIIILVVSYLSCYAILLKIITQLFYEKKML